MVFMVMPGILQPRAFPLRKALAFLALGAAFSCGTMRAASDADLTTRLEANSVVRATRVRNRAPALSVAVSTAQITAGQSSTYIIRTSRVNPNSAITVNYVMGGTAAMGVH